MLNACKESEPSNTRDPLSYYETNLFFTNESDDYAILKLDGEQYVTLMPGGIDWSTITPLPYNQQITVTLHQIDGDKYYVQPKKEFNQAIKFKTNSNYKIIITNTYLRIENTTE